jgi:hypothetical protein
MHTSLNDLKKAWCMDCKHLYVSGLKKALSRERFNKQKRPDPWAAEAVFNYVDTELDRDGRNKEGQMMSRNTSLTKASLHGTDLPQ